MTLRWEMLSDKLWAIMDNQTVLMEFIGTTDGTGSVNIRGTLNMGTDLVSPSATELAAINGMTATSTELNKLAGVTAGTAAASKAAVLGANKNLDALAIADGGLALGAGAGTAITSSAAELNLIDGSVAGTAVASKALVLGANKNVDVLAVADSGLSLGAGAGTAITKTAAQINNLAGGVAGGYLIARSASPVALDGSNPTTVATGLTTIVACGVCLSGTAAPGDSTSVLSAAINGTNIDVYAWKHTTGGAAGNPTLIASTGTESFHWWAIGT